LYQSGAGCDGIRKHLVDPRQSSILGNRGQKMSLETTGHFYTDKNYGIKEPKWLRTIHSTKGLIKPINGGGEWLFEPPTSLHPAFEQINAGLLFRVPLHEREMLFPPHRRA
jgi:hypothetical protein